MDYVTLGLTSRELVQLKGVPVELCRSHHLVTLICYLSYSTDSKITLLNSENDHVNIGLGDMIIKKLNPPTAEVIMCVDLAKQLKLI